MIFLIRSKKIQELKRPGNSKTAIVEPVRAPTIAAIRRTQVPRYVAPRTTTPHASIASTRLLPRRPVCRCSLISIMLTILSPLIHIAIHVVKPPSIGLERSHRCCLLLVPLTATTFAIGAVATNVSSPSYTTVVEPARAAYSHSASLGKR